jgi:hypothetical protein
MLILGIIKRGSPLIDHFAEPTDSVSCAHQNGFEARESRIDRIVVLSVCDAVDMLSVPRLTEAIRDALGKAPAGLIVDLTEVSSLPLSA